MLTNTPEETRLIGRKIGRALKPGDVLSLQGDLGAGKTQFVKGLAGGTGVDMDLVTSPTFVLMNRYDGTPPICHLDLYRLDAVDLEALGFFDLLATSAMVVEWGEKAGDALGDRLEVRFEVVGETKRALTFTPKGKRAKELLGE